LIGYCKACGKNQRVYVENPTKHVMHGILSLLTLGLWVIVWIFAGMSQKKYACFHCGGPIKTSWISGTTIIKK
jgi:hypothetical protein